MARIYNFSAGPATLPIEILEEVRAEFLDYQQSGMSIIEMSHRTPPYEELNAQAEKDLKELLGLADDYRVLFMTGGATTQFSLVPMNLLGAGQTADYVVTGMFAQKAWQQAQRVGKTHVAADLAAGGFRRVPQISELDFSPDPDYVHITTNNTIYGTAWRDYPHFGVKTLVADMSSDFLSQPFAADQFSLIYAGAQKNLGPAGVTVVIVKKDLLARSPATLPEVFSYASYAKNDSLYNTPPVFAVYFVAKVLKWLKEKGGLAAMGEHNRKKAAFIYDAIDRHPGFFRGHAEPDSRSIMNATFRLPDEKLEEEFVRQAQAKGFVGVKGHRSVGGMRISMYNAMPLDGCEKLAQFMEDFYKSKA